MMEWSFDGFDWNLVATLFFGAMSGYIASRILGGDGFGFFGNIVVGVIGGFIGSWLVKIANIQMMNGFFGNLISSVGGAIILIFFIELIKSMKSNNTSPRKRTTRK